MGNEVEGPLQGCCLLSLHLTPSSSWPPASETHLIIGPQREGGRLRVYQAYQAYAWYNV